MVCLSLAVELSGDKAKLRLGFAGLVGSHRAYHWRLGHESVFDVQEARYFALIVRWLFKRSQEGFRRRALMCKVP